MKNLGIGYILLLTSIIFAIVFQEGEMVRCELDLTEFSQVSKDTLEALGNKKIFFGHQSVGYNIIDGIGIVMQKNNAVKLNIKETKEMNDFGRPIFAHYCVGKNKDPFSKINDFKAIMDSGIGNVVDVAFFKLCYVDITKDTNVEEILKFYIESISYLKSRYPSIDFIHFTVPLRVEPQGLSVFVKRLLGISLEDDEDNIMRHKFNNGLKSKIDNKQIFDIAYFESVDSKGLGKFFMSKGYRYPVLAPCYTTDGGHLNNSGKKIIAEKLLLFLSTLQ